MLANNNKAVIQRLAKNTVKNNKGQFAILFTAIFLAGFMLFSVFTAGLTYLDLSRLQNTRLYGSEFDAAIMNGFSEEQRDILIKNPKVQSVGVQTYCGSVTGTDSDDSVKAGLLWADETFWECQKSPARTEMRGRYPKAENELLAAPEVLSACGKENLDVGDFLTMTYEDNTGIHTREFVISGIWKGYGGDKENFYVSEKFYAQSGYRLDSDGILQLKFKGNYVTGKTIDNLEESLALSPRQVFQASDYIENSLTILAAVCGLCLAICLSAYLLIYNILHLSVLGKIRYYGLLQTLGMTKKQLIQFIGRQISAVGVAAMAAGIGAGIIVSLLLIPHVMDLLGVSLGNTGLHFYPQVLLLSVLTTGAAVLGGIRTPIRIAAGVSPVEAVKYTPSVEVPRTDKKRKGSLYWYMAKDQLRKYKRRTIVVFLSLATSLMVFLCLTTIIDSQGKRTVYPNYMDADFILHNSTQTSEDMASLQEAMGSRFVSDIKEIKGVAEIHSVRGLPVIFPYESGGFSDDWIKGYTELKPYISYDETVSEYRRNPEKYYGVLKGIDEEEFDYLNETLGNTVNKQDFLEGKAAVLQYAGFEIPQKWIGSDVSFSAGNRAGETTLAAVNYGDYYGATVNIGPNLIVSEKYMETLTAKPYTLSLNIKYGQSYDENTENAIKNLIKTSLYSRDLLYLSKYDEMKAIEESRSGMFEIGTAIALLLLLAGMLNYINTMAGSIQNRRLTFSIMESVGMTENQVKKLLIHEGFLYGAGSLLITLTVGTGITYVVFQSMNYMKIPFAVPAVPLICAAVLAIIICIMAPVISYRRLIRNRSIAERLREYE